MIDVFYYINETSPYGFVHIYFWGKRATGLALI